MPSMSALRKINIPKSLPFVGVHLAAFIGIFVVPFSWPLVALCAGMYYLRMFAITAGYHRYFSHRTFKMNRFFQFGMALLGTTAAQKGPLWWAANHRLHHRRSDQENDIHSPLQTGFIWSHVGWILGYDHDETQWDQVQDLSKFPELVWLNKHYLIPPIALGVLMGAFFGASALAWGFLLSTVLLWHGTFTINSLSHVFGSRRYTTSDTSRNNFWLALLTLGEGWHNNHHTYMSSTQQGFFWWEIDGSYYAIKALSWIGVTSELRKPPLHLLEAKRLDRGAMDHIPLFPKKSQAPVSAAKTRSRRLPMGRVLAR